MTHFYAQYASIQPWLKTSTPQPSGKERLQSPDDRAQARRPLRMHPVRLLLDQLPQLLVEQRQVPRAGDPAPGLSLAGRQPRRGDRRAARPARGPVPPLSLPHDHELRQRLPQGPQPRQGDRGNQEAGGGARRLSDVPEGLPNGARPDPDHDGWFSWGDFPRGSFAAQTGRLLFKPDGPGRAMTRMFPDEAHQNMGGSIHGGAVMSFIDMSLFAGGRCAGMAEGHYVTLDCSHALRRARADRRAARRPCPAVEADRRRAGLLRGPLRAGRRDLLRLHRHIEEDHAARSRWAPSVRPMPRWSRRAS